MRKHFTTAYKTFQKNLKDKDYDKIVESYAILEGKHRRLHDAECLVDSLEADGIHKTPAAFEADLADREKYLDQFASAKARYEAYMESSADRYEPAESTVASQSTASHAPTQPSLKHPELRLKKFDGQVKNWTSFWTRFQTIHPDPNLSDEVKFEYLLDSVVEDSSPMQVLSRYPPTQESNRTFKEPLWTRRVNVDYYTRELVTLVTKAIQNPQSVSLSIVYQQLETQLKALETLGIPQTYCGYFLFPWVENLLPPETLKVWFRYRNQNLKNTQGLDSVSDDNLVTRASTNLTLILQFLKEEVEGDLSYQLSHQGIVQQSTKAKGSGQGYKARENKPSENSSTAASLVSTTSNPGAG